MKRMFLVMLMVMFCFTASADMWTDADEDALDMTKYLRETMSEVLVSQGVRVISTGARLMYNDSADVTYLAYIETDDGFYYYEILVNSVNDNKELADKYNVQ